MATVRTIFLEQKLNQEKIKPEVCRWFGTLLAFTSFNDVNHLKAFLSMEESTLKSYSKDLENLVSLSVVIFMSRVIIQ